jgi:7-cyano-7-deazaguanine synthase
MANGTITDILKMGRTLGVPYGHSWSCYRNEDRACGIYGSCHCRRAAFAEADMTDPIPYEV